MTHFDQIGCYDEEIPAHIREHLLSKKVGVIIGELWERWGLGVSLRGLDVGCGTGWHLSRLNEWQIGSLYGIDLSHKQIAFAKQNNPFPKMRNIDEGKEIWVSLDLFREVESLRILRVNYFSFVPDFTPKILLPVMRYLEALLESTSLTKLGAHISITLKKRN